MKKQLILILLFLAIGSVSVAQKDNTPKSNISVVAQYNSNKNQVELRFFSDKKSVLNEGLKNGFIIERAEIDAKITKEDDLNYMQIATVYPFTDSEWLQALKTEDENLKKRLEVAKSFFENIKNPQKEEKTTTNLKELIEQKKATDFEFVMLLMSAIQKPKVAFALGLAFNDTNTSKNVKYVYKVSLAKYAGPYRIVEIPYLITTSKTKIIKRKIDINVGDTKLGFSWEENDMISGVLVERRNKTTSKFEPLNKNPKYSLSENSLRNGFEDKNLTNYQQYEYRFYGFNAFGEKILFGETKAMPRDLTPPKSPLMKSATHTKPNEVVVEWQIATPVDADLKGFNVMRGTEVDGEFKKLSTKLLSKSTRTYADTKFLRDGKNYYVVQAIDTAGNISRSFSSYVTLIDTIAPMIPTFSSGEIDSTGVVTLQIAPGKDKDLMGYRLFMANSPEHEFSAIQEGFDSSEKKLEVPQHTFKDTITLKSLSPYVYYKVKALDFHHNQSDFSPIYKIKRIDTIPPTTPVFKNVVVGKNTIELKFALSQSKDVKEHFLYRKTALKDEWKVISKLENNQVFFTDKELQKGEKYFYSLRAKDDSNLFSEFAAPIYGRLYNSKTLPIQNFKVRKSNKQYLLSWVYPKQSEDIFFIIYKSNKDGKLVQYKRTEKRNLSEKITKNKNSYAVKAFTKKGGSSLMSKTILAP